MMKNGKFKSILYKTSDFYMVVKNGIQIEYTESGKYFIKSKIEFINKCIYKTTVLEVTIPNYNVKPGEFAMTEILITEDKYIKIKTKMGDKELVTVLQKID